MDERIPDIDIATGESRGWYAVDPSGHLITLGRTQSIKPGFRYATVADFGEPKPAAWDAASEKFVISDPEPLPLADREPSADEPIEPSDPDQD